MTDYSQLPEWTCHKVVRAARIVWLERSTEIGPPDGDGICHQVKNDDGSLRVTITEVRVNPNCDWSKYPKGIPDAFDDPDTIVMTDVPVAVFARSSPSLGDYLVAYNVGTKDEYVSWSPAAVFEDGYSLGRRDASALGGLTPWQRQALADIGYPDASRRPVVGDIVQYQLGSALVPLLVTDVRVHLSDGDFLLDGPIFAKGLPIERAWTEGIARGNEPGTWRWPERG